jgi:hypothetical protein
MKKYEDAHWMQIFLDCAEGFEYDELSIQCIQDDI